MTYFLLSNDFAILKSFHGTVILPDISSILCLNIILMEFESVLLDLKINGGHSDLHFMVQ